MFDYVSACICMWVYNTRAKHYKTFLPNKVLWILFKSTKKGAQEHGQENDSQQNTIKEEERRIDKIEDCVDADLKE